MSGGAPQGTVIHSNAIEKSGYRAFETRPGANLVVRCAGNARMVVLPQPFPLVPVMSSTPLDDVSGSVSTDRPSTSPAAPAPTVLRTRSQLQAAAVVELAQAMATWKRRIPSAQLRWPKLDPIDLVQAKGNTHRLAGLVQLRYKLSREEADQQVAEFLAIPA